MKQFKSVARKQLKQKRALTLVELLISVCIFALIIIGFSNIDTFSRYHVLASDRRAKLQNDASYVLEHMAKQIGQGIGDVNQVPVTLTTIGGDNAITVWIDYNNSGQRDALDKQIAYRYSATNYGIWYYSNYTDSPTSYEIISRKITAFSRSLTDNYVSVEVTACYDPEVACGTFDNPTLTLKNRISMPAVSTH